MKASLMEIYLATQYSANNAALISLPCLSKCSSTKKFLFLYLEVYENNHPMAHKRGEHPVCMPHCKETEGIYCK